MIKNPPINKIKTNGSPCLLSSWSSVVLLLDNYYKLWYFSAVSGNIWQNAIVSSIPAAKQLQKERKFYLQNDCFLLLFLEY